MAKAAFGIASNPSFSLHRPTKSKSKSNFNFTCCVSLPPSPPSFQYLTQSLSSSNSHLYSAAVVSSDSKAASFELNQPDFDVSGGGGDDTGAGNGFGDRGGGGGGGDSGKGDEGSDSEGDKRKLALSMSQKLTLGYALLVGAGGVIGYLKSGSQKSLVAGGLSAAVLYYVFTELPVRPVLASSVGLGISAALLGVMGSRFKKSGKVFPAGVVSIVSFIMTGGYLHGIMRSMH
ncbi:hypothetical protein TanjilG_29182 [Lupinus angustifolius]|uniref:Uncharacterized protein n=1 Tax=Lupinus angustifolius TaxID=3871 RepID=A0A1J7GI97_LUPAN|nr:PREDICTED: protein FATTY ACID EXPORT 2, chloroplastic-like [Lupinus angustifolius]OIW00192.1 hypothetical protein TanjilG_29182 [Lupinus angustifolius]